MNSIRVSLILSALCIMAALSNDEIALTRLKEPPDAITESFYQVEKSGRVEVGSKVIQLIRLQFEEGKSHARLSVNYENATSKAVSPKYIVRLYNPFGILLGGVRVPENSETPEPLIDPGAKGVKSLTPKISRLDSLFRHADMEGYPPDFFSVKWLSISDANTHQVDQGGTDQSATAPESKPEDGESPEPESEPAPR